jgi:hypothetical protein
LPITSYDSQQLAAAAAAFANPPMIKAERVRRKGRFLIEKLSRIILIYRLPCG